MRYLLVLGLLVSSCGGQLLEPGEYEVSSFFVQDDYLGNTGEEVITIWAIEEKDEGYTVTVMGVVKDAQGSVLDGHISIVKEVDSLCDKKTTFVADITPHEDSNTRFTGTSSLEINSCDSSLLTRSHVIGQIK